MALVEVRNLTKIYLRVGNLSWAESSAAAMRFARSMTFRSTFMQVKHLDW